MAACALVADGFRLSGLLPKPPTAPRRRRFFLNSVVPKRRACETIPAPRCHRGIFISRWRNENIRDLPRQRGGTPTGSHARRAAEVADIFRRCRDGKFRDDSNLLSDGLFHTLAIWECVPRPAMRRFAPLSSFRNFHSARAVPRHCRLRRRNENIRNLRRQAVGSFRRSPDPLAREIPDIFIPRNDLASDI